MFRLRSGRLLFVFVFGVLGIAALLSMFRYAQASGVWYVKNGGNDLADCASPATACATINGALGKAGFVAGDTVKVAAGTYTGSGDQVILVDKDVILLGGWDSGFATQSGMSTVDGQNAQIGLRITSGTINVEHFIFQHGFSDTQPGLGGGGIQNAGVLTVDQSAIQNNKSRWGGGGIVNTGTMTLNHTTVSNNVAGNGGSGGNGGGAITNYTTLTINNSTLSGNSLDGDFNGNAILNRGDLNINNSTITGNLGTSSAIDSSQGDVSLVHVTLSNSNANIGLRSGNLTYKNTIIANGSYGDCYHDPDSSTSTSLGYNLIETNSNCDLTDTDISGVDPFLAVLGNNGGPTQTMALYGGSPAIDKIPPGSCPFASDQRGTSRPKNVNCDIGAYEAIGNESTATPTLTPTMTLTPTRTRQATKTPTPKPTSDGTRKVLNETFDGKFPGKLWKVTANGWWISDCEKVSGNYSAWAIKKTGAGCGDNYPVSQKNWMIYGPFDLKKAKTADVYFKLWLNAENQKDSLFIGASHDGKKFYGVSYTGTTGGSNVQNNTEWDPSDNSFKDAPAAEIMPLVTSPTVDWATARFDLTKVYKIGNLVGQSRLYIGFAWRSDAQNTLPNGAFVDDVLITKTVKKK